MAKYGSFKAASSLGKLPQILITFLRRRCSLSAASTVWITVRIAAGKAKDGITSIQADRHIGAIIG
jgi:hypothetical protein